MTCKKCGAPLAANANFCHHCGEKQDVPTWQQPMATIAQSATPQSASPTAPLAQGSPASNAENGSPIYRGAGTPQSGVTEGSGQQPSPAPSYPAPPQYPYPYYPPVPRVSPYDAPNIGFAILCFFFPIIGLILYLVWKDEFPQRAKSAGKGALIGVITSVVMVVIVFAIVFGLTFWLIAEAPYYYY